MTWHELSAAEAVRLMDSDSKNGLSSGEGMRRLKKYGANSITSSRPPGIIRRFFRQFSDFMVLILLFAAAVSFITAIISKSGDLIDPIIILLIVILNAVIGTIQECRAEKAIDALKKLSAPHIRLLRDGKEISIPSEQAVPGDIMLFSAGDMICADGRIIEAASVRAEESSLTGEAVPVEKRSDILLPSDTSPADRSNMVYASSFIVSGRGKAVITGTGMDTQIGKIAAILHSSQRPETPLQKTLARTGKILGTGALLICFVIFILGLLQHIQPLEMFMISISLAVAAIPEGLPAIVTIVLAMGVRRLASKRAVIRRLPAVETLGRATVICSDKTGTLTQNKMTVTDLADTDGTVSSNHQNGSMLLTLAALCCDSGSDPTEKAIIDAAMKSGIKKSSLDKQFQRISEIPFDPVRKRMLTIHRLPAGGYRIIAKGAPDILIGLCRSVFSSGRSGPMTDIRRARLSARNKDFAEKGMRVIAVAFYDSPVMPDKEDTERQLNFCGFIAMTDPPRPQAFSAVAECHKAGIRTVMITGDHIITAKAIAKELGIFRSGDKSASGSELDNMSDEQLRKDIGSYTVFARVSPEHKMRIVKALRSRGEIVAMTGDGVNDAPALQAADIGCAMGRSGTDVARSAADLILTDDNFATIVSAVAQGRTIFGNIKRTIHFLLSSNIGEILTVLCAFLMRLPPPLLAIQLLWVNLVTDSLPALALGAEPAGDDIMDKSPERSGLFDRSAVFSILVEGCFIGALAFLAYTIGRVFFDGSSSDPVNARTMTFAVLSLSQLVHAFDLKSSHSLFRTGIGGNPALIAAFLTGCIMQISVISIAPLAAIFHTVPLSFNGWLIVFALSLSPVIISELEKFLTRNTNGARPA